ncbi:hypothetical protein HPB48_011706 [Haemaphysalis longicornis]|uniref:RRM domain-containing protein n=1 Tax=Haemaphysalis longicornis TaxID=44386 RepID=A0A9J6GBR4_HAELO|nr:hypothetical protein HPB48_011706 [Haemaphysalis longicornis]
MSDREGSPEEETVEEYPQGGHAEEEEEEEAATGEREEEEDGRKSREEGSPEEEDSREERRRRSRSRSSRSSRRRHRHYSRSHSRSPRRSRYYYSSRSRSWGPEAISLFLLSMWFISASSRMHCVLWAMKKRPLPLQEPQPVAHVQPEAPRWQPGQPEHEPLLGVFGLSLYTQERDLKEVFSKYGPLEDVQVVYDAQSGRSRGFAFVYFESVDDAKAAKDRCNGLEIDGRKIRVDYSITQRAHTPTPGIYMGKPS